jgi:DNA invertase Pin-like site-specific DNA recombinase
MCRETKLLRLLRHHGSSFAKDPPADEYCAINCPGDRARTLTPQLSAVGSHRDTVEIESQPGSTEDAMPPRKHPSLDPRKAVALLRISTDKRKQEMGADAQLLAIKRWAQQHDVEVVAIEDEEKSGRKSLDNREGLINCLNLLAQYGASRLIVAKIDRISRSTETYSFFLQKLRDMGGRIYTVDGVGNVEPDEEERPMDKAMRGMQVIFAELEVELTIARTKAVFEVKRERGEKLGGLVPWGFKIDHSQDDPAFPRRHKIVPDLEERALMKQAAELQASGLSLSQIAELSEQYGFKNRKGGWASRNTIYQMVLAHRSIGRSNPGEVTATQPEELRVAEAPTPERELLEEKRSA